MSLSFEEFQKLKNIYSKNMNTTLLFSKKEINNEISILSLIPFYKKLLLERGYICLKEIVLDMSLKFFPKGSKVQRYNKEKTKFYHLLYGNIEEISDYSGKNTLKKKLCINDCYFAEFNFQNYMKFINEDINIKITNFVNKIENFFPFENIKENDYMKLYLCYDDFEFKHFDFVYKEGDDVDGIYLIIEGLFEIYKKIDNGNNSYNLDKIEKKIEFLKRENNHLNQILNSNYFSKSSRNFKSQKQNVKPLFFSSNNINNLKVSI